MNRNIVKKALILAFVTLFSLLAVDIHVNAERLYELDNLYLNGDFSNGMTSWSSINYTSLSTSNGFTNGTFGTSYAYSLISQSYKMISDHKYYYNFTFNNKGIMKLSAILDLNQYYLKQRISLYLDN